MRQESDSLKFANAAARLAEVEDALTRERAWRSVLEADLVSTALAVDEIRHERDVARMQIKVIEREMLCPEVWPIGLQSAVAPLLPDIVERAVQAAEFASVLAERKK